MNSFVRKYAPVVTSIVLLPFLYSSVMAGPVGSQQAQKAAETFLKARNDRTSKGFEPLSVRDQVEPEPAGLREIRGDDGTVLAYITELEPRGFIATSADTEITPIVAYSFRTTFPSDNDIKNPLYRMLKADMKLRARALAEYEQFNTAENRKLWNLYAGNDAPDPAGETFAQWPEDNTTSTGGWLETVWDQSEPYNEFCPLDPVDANRSYVGCVATAMAQIVNYHKQCDVHFDGDDSYLTFAAINFDGDSSLYDFPSFEELNEYLTGVQSKYDGNIDINDTDAAALSFACGVAIQMDYSSEGSGASPYALREALLDKFGYYSADMTGGLSSEAYQILQENMINRLPALLSISPPDGWGGHVVVCDGYNTNGEYHLNFGWGPERPEEMTEVWYHLPGNLMSGLSIVTEAILNVQPVGPDIEVEPASLSFYAVPGQESESETLYIENNVGGAWINSISSSEGFVFTDWGGTYSDYMESFQLQGAGSRTSIYVKFSPDEARGYYGTLVINYSDGNQKYVILKGYSFTGGTEIPAGEVSGTWTQAESPYFISGDILVAQNGELVIEPGVKVMFVGQYGMTIGENARLAAEGTENSPIEFTAFNRDIGWTGLRFIDSGSDDILSHCSITFSKKNSGFITEYDSSTYENSCGGAVYCYFSDPTITNCKIANNSGDKGGAIYCDESYPIISNTVIANNASLGGYPQCGGICIGDWGEPEILNCTIVNNSPGGIFTQSWEGIDVTNTIVWGNDRYQIKTVESTATVLFCDIQDGYDGEGNMDADPCFFDPSIGVGTQYDGSAANWMLQSCSPCINSGRHISLAETDLAGNMRIYSDIIDIGAYENQSDLPLITIAPSVTGDAGFVHLDSESSIFFDIVNTGTIDFNVESLSIPDVNSVFSIVTPIDDHLLAPGDSVIVEIGFNPVEEKIYTDTLDIHSSCSNAPVKSVSLRGVGVTGTIISEGEIRGTWTKAGSPYTVTGDIEVAKGRTLTIEPGVVVKFAGHFKFTVGYRATLSALGTEEENIVFTATDTDEGWFGLRFVNTDDEDTLEYCTIEYSKKPRSGGGGYESIMGGAILCSGSWDAEPGYIVPSSPTIDHCLIANNHAEYGGGIMLTDGSEAVIINNRIVDNSADIGGAAMYIAFGGGMIANNVIAHNDSGILGGGIMNWLGYPSIINNTIVQNRPSGLHLEMTPLYPWDPDYGRPILNNIIWQNEICMPDNVFEDEYDIRFNDIQGGWEGDGNIEVDPWFADPENRDYHLKSEAGRWDPVSKNWVVDEESSPCINAGDPYSSTGDEPASHGNRVNMGAFGGTPEASKSL
ncbi:MAG: C10 family peptidase [Sedimentisphaerales bacterium]